MTKNVNLCIGCNTYDLLEDRCKGHIIESKFCPCYDCLVKPICNLPCEDWINYRKKSDYKCWIYKTE